MADRMSPREDDPKSHNGDRKIEDVNSDPVLFSCLLQPSLPDSDPNYIGIRRLLLYRKAQAGVLRRKDWRCNGKGYVAYRNYINRPKNGESVDTKLLEHSRTQVDASVDDGYHLQVHYPHSLRQTAGVLAGLWALQERVFYHHKRLLESKLLDLIRMLLED